jgi:hydrogenase/urease accessory protein HupE
LIWIAGDLKRVLITVTGFTLAHSVTLALSALDLLVLPVPAVEAVIALSVLFLAVEVAKGKMGRNSLTWRFPVVVSSVFGLLHGLGFAAVLSEIGLPQTEKLVGLVFFNVGVEIGQVVFAGLTFILIQWLTPKWPLGNGTGSAAKASMSLQTVMGYSIGCTAAYWFVGRLTAFAI